jgi:hypothetical protein
MLIWLIALLAYLVLALPSAILLVAALVCGISFRRVQPNS